MSRWKQQKEAELVKKLPKIEDGEQAEIADAPADGETLEDVERAFKEDLNVDEALTSFAERRSREAGRFRDVTDTSYYFTVCFTNLEQLVEFCESFGLDAQRMYFDGREIAKAFNKALKKPDTLRPKEQGISADYVRLARGKIELTN